MIVIYNIHHILILQFTTSKEKHNLSKIIDDSKPFTEIQLTKIKIKARYKIVQYYIVRKSCQLEWWL